MNNELAQLMNQSLLAPLIFIFMCILFFLFLGAVLYYRFLSPWIPEKLASLVGFAGSAYILITCANQYEKIKSLVASWNVIAMIMIMFFLIVTLGVVIRLIPSKKKKRDRKTNRKSNNSIKSQRLHSKLSRPDQEILSSSLESMSGAEFERILALYFRDQGFTVLEVGIGGKDGGVDLVIIDQRGEKTAVQAKCYANHNLIGVQVVRELVGAKRNHDCILSLLITTSDLTGPARTEAEKFKVDYWHGGIIEQKLKTWGKWKPGNKESKKIPKTMKSTISELQTTQKQLAVSSESTCTCGAPMIKRKSREGREFWGCTSFPKCRNTRSI
ncbi:restriction system protein [Paenibacillus castaneae]|uniref:restriction endonuclease n=1 Tax=Paenibacillus castaneae TaxID=474957 RepID=UPI001FBB37F9|nr:restriction endonuclease [Paenibacillus castaneae]NIK75042.1 restriction system protein [Paenibacillus castaneae]